jgi:16S rRNA (cytosine967-C5)-methyltransferase
VAAVVVARVLDEGAWIGAALDAELSRVGGSWEPRDRGLCTELAYGVVRWAGPLEASLLRGADKPGRGLDKRARPHLLVAAYQLQHLEERIPRRAAVHEAVNAVRRVRPGLAGFSNALLRKLGSSPHDQLAAGASSSEAAAAYGIPPLLARAVLDELDEGEAPAAFAALNERPPLSLRYTGPEADEASWADALRERATELAPHPFVPHAWLSDGAGAAEKLPGFSDGHVLVQDAGSQMVAALVAAKEGERALDMCAAPGGKSVALARAVGEGGRVVAVEKDPRRAERIHENAARLRAALEVRVQDARALGDTLGDETFDAVLLDAPCTGLGTVRRHPEIRLRRDDKAVAELTALQAELLDAAAPRVRPGGRLIYAVCSPLPDEGRAQVDAFLQRHPAFAREDVRQTLGWLPDDAVTSRGDLRLHTHRHDSDAFYAARLVREGDE